MSAATNSTQLTALVPADGHIYVLTDPGAFSAAITTTAFIKDAGGRMVAIIGEPVADRLSFYAEDGSATLPNSGFSLSFERGKHDYAHRCRDWRNCYWVNWFYPVRVKSLAPDIYVPARFSDWHAGRDPAFEDAIAFAKRKEPQAIRESAGINTCRDAKHSCGPVPNRRSDNTGSHRRVTAV